MIVLKDVPVKYLLLVLEFVYCGQVDLSREDVKEFRKVANNLKIELKQKLPATQPLSDDTITEKMSTSVMADFSTSSQDMLYSDDGAMDPSYEELMEASTIPFSIASVKSTNQDNEPPSKKSKTLDPSDEKVNSARKRTMGKCRFCDRELQKRDQNYHQKHCWKNANRFPSDCGICQKSFEMPSRLTVHMKRHHPEDIA